mmetsp:Transcript_78093/g.137819  ORF Transcript_78093/g.137819 Transcript_78093/m.137819 type:complete len:399 (-) Transcript_78093:507-1703(-)
MPFGEDRRPPQRRSGPDVWGGFLQQSFFGNCADCGHDEAASGNSSPADSELLRPSGTKAPATISTPALSRAVPEAQAWFRIHVDVLQVLRSTEFAALRRQQSRTFEHIRRLEALGSLEVTESLARRALGTEECCSREQAARDMAQEHEGRPQLPGDGGTDPELRTPRSRALRNWDKIRASIFGEYDEGQLTPTSLRAAITKRKSEVEQLIQTVHQEKQRAEQDVAAQKAAVEVARRKAQIEQQIRIKRRELQEAARQMTEVETLKNADRQGRECILYSSSVGAIRKQMTEVRRAKHLFHAHSVPYREVDVADQKALRQEIAVASGQECLPLVFVETEFFGTYEELDRWNEDGELLARLRTRGVQIVAPVRTVVQRSRSAPVAELFVPSHRVLSSPDAG